MQTDETDDREETTESKPTITIAERESREGDAAKPTITIAEREDKEDGD